MAQQPKKTKINNYEAILQPAVSIGDHTWSYTLPDLPSPPDTNRLGLVKAISIKTDGTTHTITLRLQPVSSNRALRGDPLDKFLLVSFADFHSRSLRNATPFLIGTQPATPRECTDYMVKLLRAGIILQDVHYNFYGHSNSQLKSRTCFLYAASKDVIRSKVDALGEFGRMKTVQKKAKRIGLLFSSAEVARTVDPKWCEDIPDVETKDYVFTDGCGLIAPTLARELAKGAKIVFRNQKYCPSVFQIRYRGYKGVVTVDPRMKEKGGPLLRMRKSMKKFAGGDDYSFSVVKSSKVGLLGSGNGDNAADSNSPTPLAISTTKSSCSFILSGLRGKPCYGSNNITSSFLLRHPTTHFRHSDSSRMSTSLTSQKESFSSRSTPFAPISGGSSETNTTRWSTTAASRNAGF